MLSELKNGDNGTVTKILSGNELVKRLAAMGIIVGSSISVFSGKGRGPILIESDGKRLAIGLGMAEKISVEVL